MGKYIRKYQLREWLSIDNLDSTLAIAHMQLCNWAEFTTEDPSFYFGMQLHLGNLRHQRPWHLYQYDACHDATHNNHQQPHCYRI